MPLLLLIAPAILPAQYGLKPKLYTTGSTLRGCFSDVAAPARRSTVQVLSENEWVAMGVIVDTDGHILTKASQLGANLKCKLSNRQSFDARLVSVDEATDLALLKIEAEELAPIQWRTGEDPEVGQWAITPSLRPEPTAIGVLGSPRRRIALVKTPGVLGIKLNEDNGPPLVRGVFEGMGAERAGVKVGDEVLEAGGEQLATKMQLIRLVQEYSPGDELKLRIRRKGETLEISATLSYPDHDDFLSRIAAQNRMGGNLSRRRTGFPAVLQHDSVLSPEDCGSPVVGLDGKAFGLNIARAGRTETYALPADVILPLVEEMKLRVPASTVANE
ncbi:MAG: PDZ domain-containing protein [Planctomycetaceae bacterium]